MTDYSMLRPYQRDIARHAASHPRCLVWAGMGLGKTLSMLAYLSWLRDIGEVSPDRPALVLAPLRVAASTWPQEAAKWPALGLTCLAAVGTAREREKALSVRPEIIATNYEQLPWLVSRLGDSWPFSAIIADESTRLKSFRLGGGGGSRAKALAKVAFKTPRFVGLSGTPAPNGLQDLWGQAWFVDRGERLGKSFREFSSMWFREVRCGASRFAVRLEPTPWAEEGIRKSLSDVAVSVRPEDHFPTDAPVRSVVWAELPPKAMETYREAQKAFFLELEDGEEIDIANAAVRSAKCLQIASGVVYRDAMDDAGEPWEELHQAKLDALRSVVEEAAGEPLLVAYHWRSDAARILRAFPGAVLLDRRPETIARWNRGEIQMLLVHPASAGHGLNLQDGGRRLVNFSPWWNLEEAQQALERVGPVRQLQSGHPRTVFVHDIIARGTLDEAVLERLSGKASVQDALLRAMGRVKYF